MLRRLLLYLSAAGWASSMVIHFPLARRVALRFVAGETLQSALETTRQLNEQDLAVSLDYLGESIHNAQGTREVVATYQQLLEAIHEQDLQAGISLKRTHLGLDIGEDLCQSNLQKIL
ncbi:MAG: proline dehydrogenase, partial [Anaerolineae bacterium]|nr:proline dehydrogenase [Anaerolineae bacterium]